MQPLSHRYIITDCYYCCSHCFGKSAIRMLLSVFAMASVHMSSTSLNIYAISMEFDHPHFICISIVKRKLHSDGFCSPQAYSNKNAPNEHYNLNRFKSRVNCLPILLLIFTSYYSLFHSYPTTHSITPCLMWLLSFVLG